MNIRQCTESLRAIASTADASVSVTIAASRPEIRVNQELVHDTNITLNAVIRGKTKEPRTRLGDDALGSL